MLILTIRTDKVEAEIGLYNGEERLAYKTWQAHRELAETIHHEIATLLESRNKTWSVIEGIICFAGPGSFTGLRIGLSVGNALSYGLNVPIIATKQINWLQEGIKALQSGQGTQLVLPEYGSPVHITQPRS